jgi:enoyl-[acyl-carrier protein] reductase/trans-2-enoyl-CoA reductase (NAD+)
MKAMVRNNICLNAHPKGCKKAVLDQIEYTKARAEARKNGTLSGLDERDNNGVAAPKNVLVLGCSNGYGLASRITASFAYGADTIGVSFEKAGTEKKWGTPGWYNNLAFDQAAKEANIKSITIDGDAFSNEIKDQVVKAAKENNMIFDLVVYSLASPVRTDPATGIMHKSVIKPFGKPFVGKTIDPFTKEIKEISAEPATDEEKEATIKVMGGEDWKLWIEKLVAEGLLSEGAITVAYSYIGPEVSKAIYRSGTIGKAKEHLEATAKELDDVLAGVKGSAYVSVNKGLVTRASAVIPIIPFYLTSLYKVMKADGSHEGCIEQINRLFDSRLYGFPCGKALEVAEELGCKLNDKNISVDNENRIRIDDRELSKAVQTKVDELMPKITVENMEEIADLEGYKHDFLATSGFDIEGVDYEEEITSFDGI